MCADVTMALVNTLLNVKISDLYHITFSEVIFSPVMVCPVMHMKGCEVPLRVWLIQQRVQL